MDRHPQTALAGGFLVPGRNCWRIERSQRLAFLVDGAAYFSAVRAAIRNAKHSVYIVGWDIDSRIRLVPDGANDGYPEELGEFLNEVVKRIPTLRMRVLSWDFAMVFAMDREWMPLYKLDWRTNPRLTFRLDDKHPMGASHHQKIVVVDDAIAFIGGLDLTHCRWDTPEHGCDQPGRCDPDGKPYRPYHDVQALVDGDAARALGELCRDRWHRATGRKPRPPERSGHDPWPGHVVPDVTQVDVAISRTDPGYVTGQAIEEIRHLYVDAIAAAKCSMYLENQYFSSSVVGAALAERLRSPDSPDVLVVSRRTEEGWLEERTMGVLRWRLHNQLTAADAGGHYGLYYPHVPNLQLPNVLNVHSKVLIVDDEVCSVGSANFSNRSMGFDTECNIVIEARGDASIRAAIAGLRNRLLAEHLGTEAEVVAAEIARHGGRLIKTVEALKRPGERTLELINPVVAAEIDALVPASAVVDPERPVDPEQLVTEFVPATERRPVAGRVTRVAIALVMLGAIAAAWRWTPLREWIALESLVRMAHGLDDSPFAPLVVLGAYVIAGLVVVPVTVLIVATGIIFGPLLGGLYALAGALLSAAVTYWIGAHIGRNSVRHLAGRRLNRITRRLAKKGVIAIAIIRLFPIAPFSIINAVIGASHIRMRDFLLGTALGMAPGIAMTVIFVDRVSAAVTNPGIGTFAIVAALAAVLVAVAVYVNRRFGAAKPAAKRI